MMDAVATRVPWERVTACDACGGTAFEPYMESHVPRWYDGEPLRLSRCQACRLVFADPRPERYANNRGYLEGAGNAAAAVERKLARPGVHAIHRKVIESAVALVGGEARSLFDMGFGAGSLLEAAQEMGLEAWGNDINKAGVDRLNAMGAHALLGFTRDLDIPEGRFDVVTNLDYLEHSYEPMGDLRTCFRALRPGGALYLKTLYLDCPDHLLKGEGWQLFGQGHFHFFEPRVLVTMIRDAGFEVLEVRMGPLIHVGARRPEGAPAAGGRA